MDKNTTNSTKLFNINAVKRGGVNAQQNIPIYVYNLSQRMILMRSASLDLQFEYKHEYPGKVWGWGGGGGGCVLV